MNIDEAWAGYLRRARYHAEEMARRCCDCQSRDRIDAELQAFLDQEPPATEPERMAVATKFAYSVNSVLVEDRAKHPPLPHPG